MLTYSAHYQTAVDCKLEMLHWSLQASRLTSSANDGVHLFSSPIREVNCKALDMVYARLCQHLLIPDQLQNVP